MQKKYAERRNRHDFLRSFDRISGSRTVFFWRSVCGYTAYQRCGAGAMVNLATYVGSNKGGLLGAVIATTAVMLPAFFIILFIMVISKSLLKNPFIQASMRGLKSCVVGIILATGVYMILGNCYIMTKGSVDYAAILITCVLALLYFGSRKVIKKGLSPIGLICLAAVTGMIVYGI